MATEPAIPNKQTLEAQARQLLEAARRRSGATVEEIVRALGELQPRGAETRRSWYDWQEKPETVSLLTGIASMHLLGPQATVELVFGDSQTAVVGQSTTGAEQRLNTLQRAVADVISEMAQLREQVQGLILPELEKQGQLMTKLLTDIKDAGIAATDDAQERRATRKRMSAGE